MMNLKSLTSNKPLLFLVIGAIVIILLAILIPLLQPKPSLTDLYNLGANNTADSSYSYDEFSNTDYAACVSACEIYLGNEQSDVLSCKQTCDAAKDFNSSDVSACNNQEGILKDSCITDKAVNQGKPEYCALIDEGTFRNSCYVSVAEELNDVSICNNITEEIFKTVCLDNF